MEKHLMDKHLMVYSALRNLIQLANTTLRNRYGLTLSQLVVLQTIAAGQAWQQGKVARALGVTPGTMTGIMDRLEQAGRIVRVRPTEDRRKVVAVLNSGGGAQVAEAVAAVEAALEQVLADMDPADLEAFWRVVNRLAGGRPEGTDRMSRDVADPVAIHSD